MLLKSRKFFKKNISQLEARDSSTQLALSNSLTTWHSTTSIYEKYQITRKSKLGGPFSLLVSYFESNFMN